MACCKPSDSIYNSDNYLGISHSGNNPHVQGAVFSGRILAMRGESWEKGSVLEGQADCCSSDRIGGYCISFHNPLPSLAGHWNGTCPL